MNYYDGFLNKLSITKNQRNGSDIYDQIKKLKELHDLGIIDDCEYTEKKEKLLKQI